MPSQPEIAAARAEVQRTREQLTDTIAELEERVTAPVRAVRRGLDVGRLVREHPWTALAVATGAGAMVGASGADRRAAALAADAARQGSEAAVRLAREAPERGRDALASGRSALGVAMDAVATRLAVAVIDGLRTPHADPRANDG